MKKIIRETQVKICGITTIEDGVMASELGADALGFVFAQSKRKISPDTARNIIKNLHPFITTVGVFMNEKIKNIHQIADYTGIDIIQLHGTEPPEYCRKIKKRVIKRINVSKDDTTATLIKKIEKYPASAFLLDPGGGSGQTFAWEKALGIDFPLIIAGGLTPENVKELIRLLKPYGVDVSSGVEVVPGKKDKEKLGKFIEEVK
jgi:phosphoribosylanthranilate isomerase